MLMMSSSSSHSHTFNSERNDSSSSFSSHLFTATMFIFEDIKLAERASRVDP